MRKHLITSTLVLGVSVPLIGGCVSQQQYDDMADTNRSYQSRIEELHQQKRSLEATLERKQARLDQLESEVGTMRQSQDQLSGKIRSLNEQRQMIYERLGRISLAGLHPELDEALRNLAAQNPGLIAYDSERSMIRFTSDLTFASGSDVVQAGAKAGLQSLAEILKGPVAGEYDIYVVGHTDNVPVSNPATRQRHPTNRHLSVHRAISVSEMLQTFGVPSNRLLTAGWGSQHPAIPNRARGGTPENRRVEIFLMPSMAYSPTDSYAPAQQQTTEVAPERSFPTK